MARSQRNTLIILSTLTLILAIAWFILENFCSESDIKMEPIVVSFASAVPIFSLWWPFRPKYASKRLIDNITIDLHQRKTAEIGDGDAKFFPYFSENSLTSAHLITRYHPDHVGSAIAGDANYFNEIKDASSYEISNEDKSPNINDIVIIKNRYGNYAVLKITDISQGTEKSEGLKVRIEYAINPTGGINFS